MQRVKKEENYKVINHDWKPLVNSSSEENASYKKCITELFDDLAFVKN